MPLPLLTLLSYLLARLREPSSAAGLALLMTLAGLDASKAGAIAQAIGYVAAGAAILLPERRPAPASSSSSPPASSSSSPPIEAP